jgi:hypothetical protein
VLRINSLSDERRHRPRLWLRTDPLDSVCRRVSGTGARWGCLTIGYGAMYRPVRVAHGSVSGASRPECLWPRRAIRAEDVFDVLPITDQGASEESLSK